MSTLYDRVYGKAVGDAGAEHLAASDGIYLCVLAGYQVGGSNPFKLRWAVVIGYDDARKWLGETRKWVGSISVGYILTILPDSDTPSAPAYFEGRPSVWAKFHSCDPVSVDNLPGYRTVMRGLEEWCLPDGDEPTEEIDRVGEIFRKADELAQVMTLASVEDFGVTAEQLADKVPPADVPVWSVPEPEPMIDGSPTTMAQGNLDTVWAAIQADATLLGGSLGDGIVVGVCDTGCDVGHPAFAQTRIKALSAVPGEPGDQDSNGHGTWCASAIAGKGDTTEGPPFRGLLNVAGVLAVRVLTSAGWGTDQMIASGIDLCTQAGCQVISMSLGGSGRMPATEAAIARAVAKGVILVCAAGNDGPGDDTIGYPGGYDEVTCVGALQLGSPLTVASFSSRGPAMDLAAPGVSLWGAYKGRTWARLSGTSMATPIAAAVTAAVYSRVLNGRTPSQDLAAICRRAVLGGCDSRGIQGATSSTVGSGIVQTKSSLDLAGGAPPSPPPPPPPGEGPIVIEIPRAAFDFALTWVSGLYAGILALRNKGEVTLKVGN